MFLVIDLLQAQRGGGTNTQLGNPLQSDVLSFVTTPAPTPADYSNTKELGAVLYTQHVYAFEIASVILLLAIVAAITLTMRRRPGLKVQNVARQVAVRREDRVRIVKVEPTTER